MAKIYGLFGSMTGKVADVVMAVRNGEQIARKYQPVVTNPSTAAQVASRARLKLMSQLSAVMASVIAIPRQGNMSSRNRFVKENYGLTSYADNTANVNLSQIQLTKSVVALPGIGASRGETYTSAYLNGAGQIGNLDLSRIVYVMFAKQADNTLRFAGSAVANSEGDGSWPVRDLPLVNEECVIYAYGVRDNSDAARAKFGNMTTPSASDIASLIVTRTLTEADVTLTETRSDTLTAVNA